MTLDFRRHSTEERAMRLFTVLCALFVVLMACRDNKAPHNSVISECTAGSCEPVRLKICQPNARIGATTTAAVNTIGSSSGRLLNDRVDAQGCVIYTITQEITSVFLTGHPGPATIQIEGVTHRATFGSDAYLSLLVIPNRTSPGEVKITY